MVILLKVVSSAADINAHIVAAFPHCHVAEAGCARLRKFHPRAYRDRVHKHKYIRQLFKD
jgi:hypothetical protein